MIQHIHPFIILQFIRIKSQINQNTKTQGGPQFSLCCFVDEIAHHPSSEQCICAHEWEKKNPLCIVLEKVCGSHSMNQYYGKHFLPVLIIHPPK